MADFTNAFELAILQYLTKRTALPTPPTSLEVRLHTADPGEDGTTALHPATFGYAHQTIATDINAATNTQFNVNDTDGTATRISNKATITFGPASGGNWTPITHFSIRDVDNAVVIMKGALSATLQVNDTQSAEFQDGDLRLKTD